MLTHCSTPKLQSLSYAGKLKPTVETALPLSEARSADELNEKGNGKDCPASGVSVTLITDTLILQAHRGDRDAPGCRSDAWIRMIAESNTRLRIIRACQRFQT